MYTYCFVLPLLLIAGCAPSNAPDSQVSNVADKAEQGTIVGVRTVGPAVSQLAALRVTLVAAAATDHAASGTAAFEYIVRKPAGELISVTQRDTSPLTLGQKVLVLTGNQARVVSSSSVNTVANPPAAAAFAAATPW